MQKTSTARRRFAFRLALAVGTWDVDGMLAQMPSKLLAEWEAYARLEPFGPRQEDWRAGLVAATIANGRRSANQRAYQPHDFMAQYGAEQEAVEKDWRSVLTAVELWNEALGGKDVRQ